MSAGNANMVMVDGNEAAAWVACKVSEVCAIYPITPSTTMAELADAWSNQGIKNVWGTVPSVFEMQSEAGMAGATHGALQTGAMSSTFTASQGLLLMLPNMYKIAGELSPSVIHVAARSLAAQGLSILGDHQDIMAARSTGYAILGGSSVQEAQDMALVAHSATMQSRIPFMHFFDGFRTSHEINKIAQVSDDVIRAMVDIELVREHRARALSPENPVIRGTAQNPDVYFQGRESSNRYYERVPEIVQQTMDKLAGLTGRRYRVVEYYGDPTATRVVVAMGSGLATLRATVENLNSTDYPEKVGLIGIRLYRPFPAEELIRALPDTVANIAVLDRTKEPGSNGEPLYQDVMTTLAEAFMKRQPDDPDAVMPRVIAGRYGLSSKEFTPAMCKSIYDELGKDQPKSRFTMGIIDDVTHLSIPWDDSYLISSGKQVECLFFGLGADGTVGANKNSIKIIGGLPDFHAQGYFVYDSKKSGSMTMSHLRFGPDPIDAPYLIQEASFIGCHQFTFIDTTDVLANAAKGATLLLNSPYSKEEVWEHLPAKMQQRMIDLEIEFYVVDAGTVAEKAGMGQRTNTIMQTAFFALAGVLPKNKAIELIKEAIEKTYASKGTSGADMLRNFCPDCGSSLFFEVADTPDSVAVSAGTLDDTSSFRPDANFWTDSKQDWVTIDPECRNFAQEPG